MTFVDDRRGPFLVLSGLVFLVNFGRVTFAPLVEPLQAAFDVGPAAIGIVTTLVWVGTAAPRIPVGYLLTRVRRDRVVLATGGLLSLSAAFTATAASLTTLRIGAFLVGAASGAYFVAAIPLVGDLFPDGRGNAIGIHGTASQVASVVAPSAVVALLSGVGLVRLVPLSGSWRGPFVLLSVGAAAVTTTLWLVTRRVDLPRPGAGQADFGAALSEWPTVVAGMSLVVAAGFVWQGTFNFYVSYLVGAKGLTATAASSMLTVAFAAGVPAFWASGRLADRFPQVPYLLALNAGFALALATLTVVDGVLAVGAVSAVTGYVVHSLFPAVDTYMLETLPAAHRSSAYALFSGGALLTEAGGSGAVGVLTGAGVAFDPLFRGAAGGLLVLTLSFGLAYARGRYPTPSTPT